MLLETLHPLFIRKPLIFKTKWKKPAEGCPHRMLDSKWERGKGRGQAFVHTSEQFLSWRSCTLADMLYCPNKLFNRKLGFSRTVCYALIIWSEFIDCLQFLFNYSENCIPISVKYNYLSFYSLSPSFPPLSLSLLLFIS